MPGMGGRQSTRSRTALRPRIPQGAPSRCCWFCLADSWGHQANRPIILPGTPAQGVAFWKDPSSRCDRFTCVGASEVAWKVLVPPGEKGKELDHLFFTEAASGAQEG